MELIFGYEKVYFDPASDFKFDKINEREYLNELFLELKAEQGEDFAKYNYYTLFSTNPLVNHYSASLPHKNKVLFWFSEESGNFPTQLANQYFIIFKSYIQKENINVYSNPLGYVNEFKEQREKKAKGRDINIFFSGNLNSNRRLLHQFLFFRKFKMLKFLKVLPNKILVRLFKRLGNVNLNRKNCIFLFSKAFKSGLVYSDYYQYLLRTKFILCPKGFHSNETFRHFEALHTGGVIISETMPDVPIYKGAPFITYKDNCELNQIFNKIERNEIDYNLLAEAHKTFYQSNFNVKVIAQTVSNICALHLQNH